MPGNSLTYTETFGGVTGNVTQSHIHFGGRSVAGAFFVFLCANLGNGPAGTPASPVLCGMVSGTVTAANVVAAPGQDISAGDFAALLRVPRSGDAYVNVHSVKFPAVEIRGEARAGDD